MDLQLKGKIALITGASRGLGFATALQLAREGAQLAINSRSAEKLEIAAESIRQQTGATVMAVPGDVALPETASLLIYQVVQQFGGLDILITSAGGPPPGNFESFDDEAWEKAVNLSFLSQMRLIRAALPYLRKSSAPSVLTITSTSVKQPIPNLVFSNSIRAATAGLTKTLSHELGATGIRFNSILPGWTETERVTDLMKARAKASGSSVEEEIAKQAKDIPMGRIGRPEEFANAAAFLVSPAASYINGVLLPVDGGALKGTF